MRQGSYRSYPIKRRSNKLQYFYPMKEHLYLFYLFMNLNLSPDALDTHLNKENITNSPVVATDTVDCKHADSSARHADLHQQAGGDEQVAGLVDAEQTSHQSATSDRQTQPQLYQ